MRYISIKNDPFTRRIRVIILIQLEMQGNHSRSRKNLFLKVRNFNSVHGKKCSGSTVAILAKWLLNLLHIDFKSQLTVHLNLIILLKSTIQIYSCSEALTKFQTLHVCSCHCLILLANNNYCSTYILEKYKKIHVSPKR